MRRGCAIWYGVKFLGSEVESEIWRRSLRDRGVVRSEWQTSPGPVGRDETERGIEGGQQCSSPTTGIRARRGRDHAGQSGEEEVQEFGGDAELHELGWI